MIDDLETHLALRIVDAADIDEVDEPALRIVAQEREHLDDRVGAGSDRQLAERDAMAGDRARQALSDPISQLLECCACQWIALPFDRSGATDFLLQLHDPVDERFRCRRTAGNVDVDRHDPVASPHH